MGVVGSSEGFRRSPIFEDEEEEKEPGLEVEDGRWDSLHRGHHIEDGRLKIGVLVLACPYRAREIDD